MATQIKRGKTEYETDERTVNGITFKIVINSRPRQKDWQWVVENPTADIYERYEVGKAKTKGAARQAVTKAIKRMAKGTP